MGKKNKYMGGPNPNLIPINNQFVSGGTLVSTDKGMAMVPPKPAAEAQIQAQEQCQRARSIQFGNTCGGLGSGNHGAGGSGGRGHKRHHKWQQQGPFDNVTRFQSFAGPPMRRPPLLPTQRPQMPHGPPQPTVYGQPMYGQPPVQHQNFPTAYSNIPQSPPAPVSVQSSTSYAAANTTLEVQAAQYAREQEEKARVAAAQAQQQPQLNPAQLAQYHQYYTQYYAAYFAQYSQTMDPMSAQSSAVTAAAQAASYAVYTQAATSQQLTQAITAPAAQTPSSVPSTSTQQPQDVYKAAPMLNLQSAATAASGPASGSPEDVAANWLKQAEELAKSSTPAAELAKAVISALNPPPPPPEPPTNSQLGKKVELPPPEKPTTYASSDLDPAMAALTIKRLFALKKQKQFIDLIDELDKEFVQCDIGGRGEAAMDLDCDEYEDEPSLGTQNNDRIVSPTYGERKVSYDIDDRERAKRAQQFNSFLSQMNAIQERAPQSVQPPPPPRPGPYQQQDLPGSHRPEFDRLHSEPPTLFAQPPRHLDRPPRLYDEPTRSYEGPPWHSAPPLRPYDRPPLDGPPSLYDQPPRRYGEPRFPYDHRPGGPDRLYGRQSLPPHRYPEPDPMYRPPFRDEYGRFEDQYDRYLDERDRYPPLDNSQPYPLRPPGPMDFGPRPYRDYDY